MAVALTHSLLLPPLAKPINIYTTRKLSKPILDTQWSRRNSCLWRISVASGDGVSVEVPLEKVREIVPSAASSGDGFASITISVLLFLAFIALSVLTIGVIYLAVQDFLQKREKDQFEKDEEERERREKLMKKKKKKLRGRKRF